MARQPTLWPTRKTSAGSGATADRRRSTQPAMVGRSDRLVELRDRHGDVELSGEWRIRGSTPMPSSWTPSSASAATGSTSSISRAPALSSAFAAARDGRLVFESSPGVFETFRIDAARFWYEAAPVVQAEAARVLAGLDR
jgi:hypothetical protein